LKGVVKFLGLVLLQQSEVADVFAQKSLSWILFQLRDISWSTVN